MRADELSVDQEVYYQPDETYWLNMVNQPGDYRPRLSVPPENLPLHGVVVRVFEKSAHVKVQKDQIRNSYGEELRNGGETLTLTLPVHHLHLTAVPRPKPGEPPEGMLSPNDPRLEWFWDQVAEYATSRRLCSEYDKITQHFGVPGRKKNYSVPLDVDGVTFTTSIKARSKKEAEELAKGALERIAAGAQAKEEK